MARVGWRAEDAGGEQRTAAAPEPAAEHAPELLDLELRWRDFDENTTGRERRSLRTWLGDSCRGRWRVESRRRERAAVKLRFAGAAARARGAWA
jgi:hypothetical protein